MINYRWIIVIDGIEPAIKPALPITAEVYWHKEDGSIVGNSQRNFALDLISFLNSIIHAPEYVYFLDDDTTLHPDLWNTVKDLDNDFIHFDQSWKDGTKRIGGQIKLKKVDSGNVLISCGLIGNKRWVKNKYCADGLFICDVFQYSKTPIYIPKILSVYNALQ